MLDDEARARTMVGVFAPNKCPLVRMYAGRAHKPGEEEHKRISCVALIDTGASECMVDVEFAKKIGLTLMPTEMIAVGQDGEEPASGASPVTLVLPTLAGKSMGFIVDAIIKPFH